MSGIFAIAGLTWRTALRVRLAQLLAGLVVIILLALPAAVRDDGTVVGHAQVLLLYPLGLCHALLCLAVVWLGADSFGRDMRDGHVHLLATKPISPAALWLGKWLGVTAVGGSLLALAALGVLARVPDGAREALAGHVERTGAGVTDIVRLRPGESFTWTFEHGPSPGTPVEVRLCVRTPADVPGGLRADVVFGGQSGVVTLLPGRRQVFDWKEPQGPLSLRLTSHGPGELAMPLRDQPTVRWRVGSFAGNYLRAVVLLALQLAFLAALGLAAGSALSFPVAVFASVAYLVAALHAPFLRPMAAGTAPVDQVMAALSRFGLALTDALHRWWPLGRLAAGDLVGWDEIGRAVWRLGVIETGVVMAVGMALWSAREPGLGGRE
jgi:hypothetical protein